MLETLKLYTVVHPMEHDNPFNAAKGWRWAIQTNNRFDQWGTGVLNAGQEASQGDAESVLSMVLVTVRRALAAANVRAEVAASVLTDCPLNVALADELAVLI